MLFPKQHWAGLQDGSITVAFRRWRQPAVKAGGSQRFAGGVLAFDEVRAVTLKSITAAEARRAGYARRDDLIGRLGGEGKIYRVELRYAGADPRVELRQQAEWKADEVEALGRRLERWQAIPILEAIRDNPGRRAPDLAEAFGKETLPFKAQVRRLKELGLTESLRVGYRLSPRGEEFLRRLEGR